jgi:cytochrome P450
MPRIAALYHIAFGYGIHVCLGAELARVELRSLFGKLVRRCGRGRGDATRA